MSPYEKVYETFVKTVEMLNKQLEDHKIGIENYRVIMQIITIGFSEVAKYL